MLNSLHMYDEDERIIELASQMPRKPAWMIKEELGSSRSVRRIQEIINERLGRRPTRASIQLRDVVRDRVVAYMEAQGLSRYYCFACERRFLEPLFIQEIASDESLDSLVFVCRHCAGPSAR